MFKCCAMALAAAAAAAPAFAQDDGYGNDYPARTNNDKVVWADVLSVDPQYDEVVVTRPREECYDEQIDRRDSRGNNAAGTVIGAIVGGALGNTVGKGDGRKAATVAGAVVGGAIGNNAARRDDRYYSNSETRCRVIDDRVSERRIVGYDVQYRYRGDVYMSQLDYDPGSRMRVRVSVTPAEQ